MGKNTLTLMAKRIRQLMATVDRLNERLKSLENKDTWESYISQEDTPCQYIFYICRVTSVSAADNLFYARALEPGTSTTSPWVDDTDLTSIFTVVVPTAGFLPDVGKVVHIDFTGTYGTSFLPRYGHFAHQQRWEYAKMDANIGPTEVKTASIYRYTGAAWTSTGSKVAVLMPPVLSTETVNANKWVDIEFNEANNYWIIRGREC